MEDDGASTACETEFAGGRNDMAEQVRARLGGSEERNTFNFDVGGGAPNDAGRLDPALVRVLATRLFTEGNGALTQVLECPLAADRLFRPCCGS